MLDDVQLSSSGLLLGLPGVSGSFALVDLGELLGLASLDVGNSLLEDSLLESQSVLVLLEGDSEVRQGVLDVSSGGGDLTLKLVILVDGLSFFSGIILNGSLDGSVELLHLVDDAGEGLLGESRGDLDEGEDGVGGSDLGQLGEDEAVVVGVWVDGGQLLDDQFQGSQDFWGFLLSSGELSGISSSGAIQFVISGVQDLQLGFLDSDFSGDSGNLSGQDLDFSLGGVSLERVIGDASVEGGNGISTLLLLGVVDGIGIGLLSDQIQSDLLQQLSNSLESRNTRISRNLESDSVKQLLSELVRFERL